jgi:hypothetical protein
MQWWIGDWVNYGGKRYGETYLAAIEATGMSYGTVQSFASVCRAFENTRRRVNLAFGHHVAVWSLDHEQQDELFDRAESEGLSCAKLREIVRSMKCIESVADGDSEPCSEPNESDPVESIVDGFLEKCVASESKLNAIRLIIERLEPYEAAIVRDWLRERLH